MDEEEDGYSNAEGVEEDTNEELDEMDEEMDDVNGASSVVDAAFPILDPNLKSVMSSARKIQGKLHLPYLCHIESRSPIQNPPSCLPQQAHKKLCTRSDAPPTG